MRSSTRSSTRSTQKRRTPPLNAPYTFTLRWSELVPTMLSQLQPLGRGPTARSSRRHHHSFELLPRSGNTTEVFENPPPGDGQVHLIWGWIKTAPSTE